MKRYAPPRVPPPCKNRGRFFFAGVVELVDSVDLGSSGIAVQVRVLSPAPKGSLTMRWGSLLVRKRDGTRTHVTVTFRWNVTAPSAHTGSNHNIIESCRLEARPPLPSGGGLVGAEKRQDSNPSNCDIPVECHSPPVRPLGATIISSSLVAWRQCSRTIRCGDFVAWGKRQGPSQ